MQGSQATTFKSSVAIGGQEKDWVHPCSQPSTTLQFQKTKCLLIMYRYS